MKHWCSAIAIMLVTCSVAGAAETQLWIHDGPADHAAAETRGVVVRPDGVIALGPAARSHAADSTTVIWALLPLPDGSVAIAGDRGRIDRWTSAGGVRPWVRLAAGQVLSLATDGDGLIAGTGPDGRIYRVSAGGDTSLLVKTGERYVWALASAGKGAWYAATGSRGRLLKVQQGASRVMLDSEESHLISCISDGRGGAYAGGDSRGGLVHVSAGGEARTLFDASEEEIRALALGADGSVYAAALSASAVALTGAAVDDDESDGPAGSAAPVRAAVSGGRATVYRIIPDSVVTTLWTSPQPLLYALASYRGALAPEGGVLAASGNRAGVWLVNPNGGASQWMAMPQGQVTALAVTPRGEIFAATSNPGALWQLGPERAARGELISAPLDARRIAAFGRVAWQGRGRGAKLDTRSGNTDKPDTTWSAWKSVGADDRSASAPARYLQYRLELSGDAEVSAIEAFYRERNLAPRVDELAVAPQGLGFREGELQPRSEPVTQSLPGGQRVEYSISNQPTRPLRGLPAFARGLRTLQWRGNDPNGDALRYSVELRREGEDGWIKLGEDYEATSFTWDTQSIPDGRYRVRVTATDRAGNAVGEERSGSATSEPFTVDNTAPRLTAFEAGADGSGITISGAGEDGESVLWRVEVSLDDADWRPVTPESGLADSRQVRFRARLSDVERGLHSVAVRVVDLAGNTASRSLPVTVAVRR
ncbi:MAG: fibronectin type III domain-containing protein [Candidatus Eisenbacteria bacterium]|uniref:Fibronectin type III domain-containing protein n=1 Tax=Eiseniibacteriota bacterium TaxID=2212470 RepID=A0A849SK90_UNCEI|nr:fibronectin type III domain-containing protein [Candidatus Eisenbacteria bacterium]